MGFMMDNANFRALPAAAAGRAAARRCRCSSRTRSSCPRVAARAEEKKNVADHPRPPPGRLLSRRRTFSPAENCPMSRRRLRVPARSRSCWCSPAASTLPTEKERTERARSTTTWASRRSSTATCRSAFTRVLKRVAGAATRTTRRRTTRWASCCTWPSTGRTRPSSTTSRRSRCGRPSPRRRRTWPTCYLDQGRYDEAIKLYEQALNDMLYPTPYIAQGNLGWALYKKGETDAGAAEHQGGGDHQPEVLPGFRNLGIIYDETGRPDEACTQFGRYRETCPDVGGRATCARACARRSGARWTRRSRASPSCEAKAQPQDAQGRLPQLAGAARSP